MEEKYSMCWLQYNTLKDKESYKDYIKNIIYFEENDKINACIGELKRFIKEGFNKTPKLIKYELPQKVSGIIIGKIEQLKQLGLEIEKNNLKDEGFLIKEVDKNLIAVLANSYNGLVYGTFELIKLIILGEKLNDINIIKNPKANLRIINHWDNFDGTIERGYAGKSIFYKDNKILLNSKRIVDYARLLSSIGINSIILNNVNVKKREVEFLTEPYLKKFQKIANIFGKYGIKIFLSINFASPIYLGKLPTADPLDKDVCKWWEDKAKEIYDIIPNFGGFLVKADSEFNPGPYVYNRSHADGANMLAKALKHYGGLVIWRCFVYNCRQDWRDTKTDRAKAAYDNFKPFDGLFDDNVVLQIKLGPMDFQVREPVSPLFGALLKTNQIIEFQITQEYTGQQIHLCYLGQLWKEALDFDTYAQGEGSFVKRIVDGSLFNKTNCGLAGVSNIGDDFNWTGHDLAQANLYTFGKLSWNPDEKIEDIVDEWIKLTFGHNKKVIEGITYLLLNSHSIYEKYTTPLGLGWMINPGHHYGPSPEGYEFSMWGTYHRASTEAIGVDRTSKGTKYTSQYSKHWQEIYDDINKCPEKLLLFFHRVNWNHKLKNGKTLIQYMYDTHFEGVEEVKVLIEKWTELKDLVSNDVYDRVLDRLNKQYEHSKEWRDVINTYFYRKTGIKDEQKRHIYE